MSNKVSKQITEEVVNNEEVAQDQTTVTVEVSEAELLQQLGNIAEGEKVGFKERVKGFWNKYKTPIVAVTGTVVGGVVVASVTRDRGGNVDVPTDVIENVTPVLELPETLEDINTETIDEIVESVEE